MKRKRFTDDVLREECGLGVTRARGLTGISRSLYRCRRRRDPPALVARRRKRKRRRIGPVERQPLPEPSAPNISWSMGLSPTGWVMDVGCAV